MKNNNAIILGVAVIGGGLLLANSKVREGLGNIFGGVGTAVSGTGQAVSEVANTTSDVYKEVTKPVYIVGSASDYISSQIDTQKDRSLRKEQGRIDSGIDEYIGTEEATAELKKAQTTTTKTDRTLRKEQTKTEVSSIKNASTVAAAKANAAEDTARKTEYGSSVGEYLKKTFLPTKEVAQERRESAANTLKSIASNVKSAASSTVSKVTSSISSWFKDKKLRK